MNKQELIQKLQDIEWEDFEVKEAKREVPKSSWETVSAFVNTAGGWLIFGIKKSGRNFEVVGVEHPEKIERDFLTVYGAMYRFGIPLLKCPRITIQSAPLTSVFFQSQGHIGD